MLAVRGNNLPKPELSEVFMISIWYLFFHLSKSANIKRTSRDYSVKEEKSSHFFKKVSNLDEYM